MRRDTKAGATTVLVLLATLATAGVAAQSTATTTAGATATFVYQGDRLTVEAAPSQQIRGEASLPPDSRITIRIASTDSSSPFIRLLETTVEEDGTFIATGDFSNIDQGTSFEIAARYNGTTVAKTVGQVVTCDSRCTQTQSQTDRSTTFPAAEPGFPNSIVQVETGGRVEIPVALGDRDRIQVTIGDTDVNYRLNATLVDGNEDGRVVAVFDTTKAGTEGPTLTAGGIGDRIEIESETTLSDGLDPTEYDLALYATTDRSTQIGVGTLVLVDGGTATPATGPGTPTAPLDDTTPSTDRAVDFGGLGALSMGLLLGVLGIALVLGLFRY